MTTTFVVDASVALKWVLPEEDSGLAEGLARDDLRDRVALLSELR